MELGDRVKDTGTGRQGVIVEFVTNHIIPGMKQALVDFGGSSELLYLTRLKFVSPAPGIFDMERLLRELDAEQQLLRELDAEGQD